MNIVKEDGDRYFVYNGKSSLDFGIHIYSPQILNTPKKKREIIEVSGRNGDIIIEDGSYENVEITFKDCFIINDFAENFKAFKDFVCSQKGYKRLEISWLPDEYRMAMFDGNITPVIKDFDGFGKFDLVFICKPQRFLKSGEIPVEVPCSPAPSPASARRYWRLSQFASDTVDYITENLQSIGYTSTEISAMQFCVMSLNTPEVSEIINKFLQGENITEIAEFKGADTDRFFAFFHSSPFMDNEYHEYYTHFFNRPVTALANYGFLDQAYVITKKSFGIECWWGDIKYTQDETYQFGTIVNPTRFDALPKFKVQLPSDMTGMAGATVYMAGVGQDGIALKWTADMAQYTNCVVTLDAELMDAYILPEDNTVTNPAISGIFVSFNSAVKFYGNRISLKPDENTIRLDQMIAGCEIVPRWWTI